MSTAIHTLRTFALAAAITVIAAAALSALQPGVAHAERLGTLGLTGALTGSAVVFVSTAPPGSSGQTQAEYAHYQALVASARADVAPALDPGSTTCGIFDFTAGLDAYAERDRATVYALRLAAIANVCDDDEVRRVRSVERPRHGYDRGDL